MVKNGGEICNFLSTLFRNKDFISQESALILPNYNHNLMNLTYPKNAKNCNAMEN